MIKINNTEIKFIKFPDGTCGKFDLEPSSFISQHSREESFFSFNIVWQYESDEEYIRLKYIVDHLREKSKVNWLSLTMPYIPNARMDRTKNDSEIFTLKYFANFINSLNFNRVNVLDPHSYVSVALINNVTILPIDFYINSAIHDIMKKNKLSSRNNIVVYFPDEGAYKRYKDIVCLSENEKLYGKKVRDWETGNIISLDIYNEREEKLVNHYGFDMETGGLDGKTEVFSEEFLPLENKVVLMVDDIISYGGTLAHSADKLKEFGASAVYAYATHTENSVLDEEKGALLSRLKSGVVNKIFTTNSIFNKENNFVTVFMCY